MGFCWGSSWDASSPRSWRCFWLVAAPLLTWFVFSTLVEVFLRHLRQRHITKSLLHARGGVSNAEDGVDKALSSSPRSWRCFQPHARQLH